MKNNIWDHIRKKQNILTMCFCILGVGLNLLFGSIAAALGLPFYLNTVGTVLVAVPGGALPGVIVAFATSTINGIIEPSSFYYGSLNALIALFAALLSRWGWLKKIKGIIGTVLVFALIRGGLGALITWFMEDLSFESDSLSGMLYGAGFFGEFSSHLLSSIIMIILDSAITVVIVLIILYFISKIRNVHLGFVFWAQKPLSDADIEFADKSKTRIASLKGKVLLVQALALILISVLGIALSVRAYRESIIEEHSSIAMGTARTAAALIDGDKVDEFLENGEAAPGYTETLDTLEAVFNNSTDIEYLYVYRILEDGCHVVYDIKTDDVEAEETGTVIELDEGFGDYTSDLLEGREVEPVITGNSWGYLLTAYYPVYASDGTCACYVGADVDLGQVNKKTYKFLTEIVSVFLGVFLLFGVLISWLAKYHVSLPLKTITRRVYDLVGSENTQQELDENLKRFREIDIRTGDEVEMLYNAICSMSSNQFEYIRSIRRLSEATSKMQDGLIITMADMVDNRDSDTGAHIQKTAAYVRIIVEGLKKKGYYAEKLTPKFMSDAVRSAPLHDVGKISIPDEVLNKAGKLSDEEYEIMKTHTTEGKRIMEHAISTVEGDNYLKEARNMAAYHHERWDGKGYPEGLHGEVIPLSARIMAVADVFDALTSPRVYKPAFTLEKALSILNEGKGTQFDPRCVEVFMDALDEVKVVLRKYNPESL